MVMINNPNRIKEIEEMLDSLIVGEKENKMVLFLNCLSCFLDQPNGTIITGEASAGKTHLVREVLKLFPKEMKIVLGGASKKALIHMRGVMEHRSEDNMHQIVKIIDFSGKILWFLEDQGAEESYSILRPILSRDQEEIRFELPTKKKGKAGSEFFANDVIIIKGCPAFITTSIRIERLPETGTRVFQLSPDESKEQSKRVVDWKLNKERFRKKAIDFKEIKDYIRSLKGYDVWIPYTDLIYITCENLNIRRDVDKIIAITKVVTLFNQHERKTIIINDQELMIATLMDYITSMEYLVPVMNPTLFNLPKKILDFYNVMRHDFPAGNFTHRMIAENTQYGQETARRYCWELSKANWLIRLKTESIREISYNFDIKKTDTSVTNMTFDMVTQDMIARSILDTKIYIIASVTENKMINNYIYDILIYIFSVTLPNLTYLHPDKLKEELNSVIFRESHDGHNSHTLSTPQPECRLCGLKTIYLDDSLLCEFCREDEDGKN